MYLKIKRVFTVNIYVGSLEGCDDGLEGWEDGWVDGCEGRPDGWRLGCTVGFLIQKGKQKDETFLH